MSRNERNMDNLVFGHNNVISESLSKIGDYAWPNFLSGYRELRLTSYLSKFVYVLLPQSPLYKC